MRFEQARKKAEEHTWWSEECPGKWQYCYWMYGAVEQQLYFTPGLLSVVFCTFRNGYTQEKTSEEEKLQQYFWLKAKFQEDRGFIDQEHDRWLRVRDEKIATANQIINHEGSWTREELLQSYSTLLMLAIDSVRWGFWLENVDVYTNNELPKQMQSLFPEMSPTDRSSLAVALCTPLVVSFMEEYRIDKYELILNYRAELETPSDDCKKAVRAFHHQYRYITVNYGGSPPLTEEDIWREILEDAAQYTDGKLRAEIEEIEQKVERTAKTQSSLEQEYAFPADLLDDFTIIRAIGAWMDERKESMVKVSFAIWTILGNIAEVAGVPKSQLEWYTIEELKALLEDGARVEPEALQQRNENSVFAASYDESHGTQIDIFTGEEANQLYELLNAGDRETLSGTVASAPASAGGSFSGTAQVVVDTEQDAFEKGNILVTSMTRPDFVPLMKKAAAIITNEGGMTCHAAIVSRELGIPCIIGTKHATETLHTGDAVLMNLSTGVITKTER